MLKVYGDVRSGNCYKVQLICALLNLEYEWFDIDLVKKETKTFEFLAINPVGQVPVLQVDDKILLESNAIMDYLATNSKFIPTDKFAYAQMLQWQFYEQALFRGNVGVIRWIKQFESNPEPRQQEYQDKLLITIKQFEYLENYLTQHNFLVGESVTLADITLFAYAHVADQGGIDFDKYPHVVNWLNRIKSLPNFLPMQLGDK